MPGNQAQFGWLILHPEVSWVYMFLIYPMNKGNVVNFPYSIMFNNRLYAGFFSCSRNAFIFNTFNFPLFFIQKG